MFGRIRKKISGLLTLSDLQRRSENALKKALQDAQKREDNLAFRMLHSRAELMDQWRNFHSERLPRIADGTTSDEQLLALRGETLDLIEQIATSLVYLSEEFSDDDLAILSKKVHPELSPEIHAAKRRLEYVFAEASCYCLRQILLQLGHEIEQDLYTYYCELCCISIDYSCKEVVASAKGRPIRRIPFRRLVEEARDHIIRGENYAPDLEAIRAEFAQSGEDE